MSLRKKREQKLMNAKKKKNSQPYYQQLRIKSKWTGKKLI